MLLRPMLACGPYFSGGQILLSILVLLVLKPTRCFAFICAFRYRVSRDIPMTTGQAVSLAFLRTLVGVPFSLAGIFLTSGQLGVPSAFVPVSIGWLVLSRLAAWCLIFAFYAKLSGRRLAAWVGFGTLLNLLLDGAFAVNLIAGPIGLLAFALPALLISVLDIRGSRRELQARFGGAPRCAKCQYNLTGNLSGICPECGTPIAHGVPAQ